MAEEGIKQKIELTGEKEYSAALKEANRNLKTLRSELKAETAELGANATAQAKNEVKVRSLKKQIEQQEKVVETLRKALNEVKEKYGDNSEEVAKWEQKLNNARYSLADMNNKLQQTQDDLKKNMDAVKESGEAYDDAADKATDFANATDAAGATANAVTFQGVISAADNLTGKLRGAFDVIKELSKASWEWMKESGSWADELTTNAAKYKIDRQTLQGWDFAARMIDTDVDTIANAFKKLTNRSDATNKKLAEMGIVADKGVQAKDVFWEVIEAMEGMDDAARENAASDIFGKSFQDLLPLIDAGREKWEQYVKEAEDSGYVLDEDQLNNLTAFDDAWQRMDTSVLALKHTLAAELAPAFETIATSLTNMVDKFLEWSKSEEGKETLKGLGEALNTIVKSLSSEENFKGLVEGAAGAIRNLTGALDWINTNWSTVETGLKAIGIGFAGITVGKEVLSALMLIKGINWLTVGKGLNGGNPSAPAAEPTPTATPTSSPGAISTWVTNAMGKAGALLSKVSPFMMNNGAFVYDWFKNQTSIGRAALRGEGTIPEAVQETIDDVKENIIDWGDTAKGVYENWARFWDDFWKMPEVDMNSGEAQAALGFKFTPEQIAAAQQYWDEYRSGADGGEGLDKLTDLIPDDDVLNALLDKVENFAFINDTIEDLPDQWFADILDAVTWESNGEEGRSEDVTGFAALPEQIKEFAKAGIVEGASGLSITMDGYSVGQVTAPYVSQIIASQMV